MLLTDFIIFLVESINLSYEDEIYMKGYLEALHLCDSDVTVHSFGNPFFIKLYELCIKSGKINKEVVDIPDFMKSSNEDDITVLFNKKGEIKKDEIL